MLKYAAHTYEATLTGVDLDVMSTDLQASCNYKRLPLTNYLFLLLLLPCPQIEFVRAISNFPPATRAQHSPGSPKLAPTHLKLSLHTIASASSAQHSQCCLDMFTIDSVSPSDELATFIAHHACINVKLNFHDYH
jgi:hypothetical protein